MTWAIILSFLAMFIGLAGVIFPFLPGVPVAWLGLFGFAYYTQYTEVSVRALWIFGGLTLLTFVMDYFIPALSAKIQHSSKHGVAGVFWGTILGVWILGPFGIVVGPVLGAFLGEIFAGKSTQEAYRSALGALAGFLIGSALKMLIVLSMIVYLVIKLIA